MITQADVKIARAQVVQEIPESQLTQYVIDHMYDEGIRQLVSDATYDEIQVGQFYYRNSTKEAAVVTSIGDHVAFVTGYDMVPTPTTMKIEEFQALYMVPTSVKFNTDIMYNYLALKKAKKVDLQRFEDACEAEIQQQQGYASLKANLVFLGCALFAALLVALPFIIVG